MAYAHFMPTTRRGRLWSPDGVGDTENLWETCKERNAATGDGSWSLSGSVFGSGTSDLESVFVVFKIIFFSIISILYGPYSG